MNTLKYRKKEYHKQPRIQDPITHVVFVTEEGKFVSSTNPIRVEGVQRITRSSHLDANLPAVIAVLVIDKADNVLYTRPAKVHNRAQFNLFIQEVLKDKAKVDAEKAAKEPVDA